MPARDTSNRAALSPLRRVALSTVVCWAMMGLYLFINRRPLGPITTFEMPAWVPFSPPFLLPYLGLLLVTWLLPVALRDPHRFRGCLRAYACGYLLVAPWWIFTPTMLQRPPLPDGLWAHVFAWLWKADQPFNITPCAHVVGPIIAAWFAAQEYPRWRWPLAIMLLLALPSIALVWQHRPTDILLGGIASIIGIVVAEKVSRKTLRATPAAARG
jgi:hypothetical protein